jgi:minor extracellular serine protease Vpr
MKSTITYIAGCFALAITGVASAAPPQELEKKWTPEISGVKQNTYVNKQVARTQLMSTHGIYIVQLDDKSVAQYRGNIPGMAATSIDITGKSRIQPFSGNAKSYRNYLKKQQAMVIQSIKSKFSDAQIKNSMNTIFNGLVVQLKKSDVDALRAMDGVKAVYKNHMYHQNMDRSHEVIKSVEAWMALGGISEAGKGMRVAILDGGIRPGNPMFSGDGFEPLDLSENVNLTDNPDYCRGVDAEFCNNKLIVARHSWSFGPLPEGEHDSPLGRGTHGSHVAGSAVGNPVQTDLAGEEVTISGVAPAAYLMAYKGLFGGSGGDADLIPLLEHAVLDGADVINNSWGGGGDPATSSYPTVFANIEAAGVVTANAAGNSGSGAQTIGCPACSESGIAVANTTHGRFVSNTVSVNGMELMAIEGNNVLLTESITATVVASALVDADNFEGCVAYPENFFTDSVALVSRGSCSFSDKANNAAAAGATALLVYNSSAAQPIPMFLPDATVPSLMVSAADGASIISMIGDSESALSLTLQSEKSRVIIPEFTDNMATSSSRGPNVDASYLKPDIGAPGTDILSAASPEDFGMEEGVVYTRISGTSMASPHVAGAAALVAQAHPDWNAVEIKTALMSTSDFGILKEDAETPSDAFDIGAGRLNVEAAIMAAVTFSKGSFADTACVASCDFTNTISNKMTEAGDWTATVMMNDSDGVSATITPSTLSLAAVGTEGADADFILNFNTSQATQGSWVFGHVVWTHTSGQTAHLPFTVFANESTDAELLSTFSTDASIENGTAINATTQVVNNSFSDEITVSIDIPANTTLVEGSLVDDITGGTTTSFEVDSDTGKINWVGNLDTAEISVIEVPSPFGPLALAPNFGIGAAPCTGGCDEIAILLNWPFEYNGVQYTTLTVSDNGFVTAGNGNTNGSFNNQAIPNSSEPNNVLAPLWSDFDLADTDGAAGDTGGGAIRLAVLSGGGADYLFVEWDSVQLWGDASGDAYSFQVIIQANSTNIWFNYLSLPNLPQFVTVGAEDSTGESGSLYHFNGQLGAIPTGADLGPAGFSLLVSAIAGGSADLNYQLIASDSSGYATDDTAATDEEVAIFIDILANDSGDANLTLASTLTTTGVEHNAFKYLQSTANGGLQPSTVTVTTDPANGTATVNSNGSIAYVPATDFFGSDSFMYTVSDAAGLTSEATSVVVTVANVNDAPTVTVSSPGGVEEMQNITLTAVGTDVDNDDLTYTWTQISGPALAVSGSGATLTATSSNLSEDQVAAFIVTANDAESSSLAATVSFRINNRPSSSGSMGWLLALVLLPLLVRRRQKIK